MGRSADVRVGLQAGGLLSGFSPPPRTNSGAAVARAGRFLSRPSVRVAVDGEAADAEPGGDPRD